MLKNKIKAVKGKESDKVAAMTEAVSRAQFSYFDTTVSERRDGRRFQSAVQSLWGFHCTAWTHWHCQDTLTLPGTRAHRHTTARRVAVLRVTTWIRTTEQGQTSAAELHIHVGISRDALTWAKQEILRFMWGTEQEWCSVVLVTIARNACMLF